MNSSGRALFLVVIMLLEVVGQAVAQESREELLRRSVEAVDDATRLRLLMSAADPDLAPLDSVWAGGVYTLADLLIDLDDRELASVWLRWVARYGEQWPINEIVFRRGVVGEYNQAVQTVADSRSVGDAWTTTRWQWPTSLDPTATGTLEVTGDRSVPLTVTVQGRGVFSGSESLPPDTYILDIEAEGHESTRITREVLPGVTTTVSVDLPPLLPASVEAAVVQSLVRITYVEGGQQVCTNGVLDERGLVLTLLSGLGSAASFEVTTAQGTFSNVEVLDRDGARDLAVLDLRTGSSIPLTEATAVEDGQYVWSVHGAGCGPPTPARTRIATWTPTNPVSLTSVLPGTALGSPVVDRTGALLGLVTRPDELMPGAMARELLARAIRALDDQLIIAQSGGGGPWKWIGGAGAVGALAIALLGGGDSSPSPSPLPPTTGDLEVTIPGGEE